MAIGIIKLQPQKHTPLDIPEVRTPEDISNAYDKQASQSALSALTATPPPTPTPKPTPMSFADTNKLYGPCVVLPTLMYHHVENLDKAKTEGHASLTVGTENFRKHMQYLKDKAYNVLSMTSLLDFFDHGTAIPKKSVLLTFDDGYEDFNTDAAPILREFGFPSTMFIPTGLVQNPGYLQWSEIKDLSANSKVQMSNHTWSHHNMAASSAVIQKEIGTADTQLTQAGLNTPKFFAYPYGLTSKQAVSYLSQTGYLIAFTTEHGSTLCKQQRLTLPRIRVGNAPLSSYGL